MNNDAFVKNVASRLIEQIRNRTAPWQKPWRPGTSFLPFNPTNGTRYKGINVVNLLSRGYGDSRWMTYRQAQIRGYQVRKGEKGTQVQYWRFDEERKIKDSNGEPRTEENYYSTLLHELGHNADFRIMPLAFPVPRSVRVNPITWSA